MGIAPSAIGIAFGASCRVTRPACVRPIPGRRRHAVIL